MKRMLCLLLCLCLTLWGAASLAEADDSEAAAEVSFEDAGEEAPRADPEEAVARDAEKEESPARDAEPEPNAQAAEPEPAPDTQPADEPATVAEPAPAPDIQADEEPATVAEAAPDAQTDEEPAADAEQAEADQTPAAEDENPPDAPDDPFDAADETPEAADETPEAPEIPADAQAWVNLDGEPFYGSLSAVIELLDGGETVYLRTDQTVPVSAAPLDVLAEVSFRADGDVFDGDAVVRLYGSDPDDGGEILDFSAFPEGATADVWFRVESAEDGPEDPEDEPGAIRVSPDAFAEGEWINSAPVFTLSGIPEGENWIYAAIVYDDRIIPLFGDTYVPENDGTYTLQFVIQDELGDLVSVSDRITVWLDWTKPKVTIENSKTEDYALNITATDALSGVASLSIDGGKTWRAALDAATYTYAAQSRATLPAGQIRVKDYAGNVYASEKAYELTSIKATGEKTTATATATASGSAKKSSSSSSSSSSGGTSSHASDSEGAAASDALRLVLPDEPMRQLTVDGQAMALTLMLESGGIATPIRFTGSVRAWYTGDGRMSDAPNLLVLDADLEDVGDVFNCRWSINGEVFRRLNSAGVDYVAFMALDDVCVVPTAGFIGGTGYTELKRQGVSTKAFDYTLTMKLNRDINILTALSENDLSEDCDLSLRVDVENRGYEINSSAMNPIYYYDVYLGPEAMLSVPLGQYQG